MSRSWRRKQSLVYVFLLSNTLVDSQFTYFGYCCEISKCILVEKACRDAPVVRGETCVEACLADADFTCKPSDLDTLAARNYTCFERFVKDVPRHPLGIVCQQRYVRGRPAAPQFLISYAECVKNCGGWDLTLWLDLIVWASPLVQYIIPAVIFSMNIPRRRRLAGGASLFNASTNQWMTPWRTLFSRMFAGIIVLVDSIVWVCIIVTMAGPMIADGLLEALLDGRVVRNLRTSREGGTKIPHLSIAERVQLTSAVLCGNLDRSVNDPQGTVDAVINVFGSKPSRERAKVVQDAHSALLTSQSGFGPTVGVAILVYLVAFLYTLVTIYKDKGENDVAHGLAFGMWWMAVVHTAIVAGCLLGNNNASTVKGIVSQCYRKNTPDNSRWAKLGVTAAYDSQFQPVTMWSRGLSKYNWICHTTAWRRSCWFRRRIEVRLKGWIAIGAASWILILIPSSLAFLVSYNTPTVGVGCRSMTFLLYACSQTVLIPLTIYRNISVISEFSFMDDEFASENNLVLSESHATSESDGATTENHVVNAKTDDASSSAATNIRSRDSSIVASEDVSEDGLVTAVPDVTTLYNRKIWCQNTKAGLASGFLIFIACISMFMALFTGIAGTMMQVLGVYSNCKCAFSIIYWFNPRGQTCNIASDTEADRRASVWWSKTGYAAITFMAATCYLGWWYQRYLRSRFLGEIKKLGSDIAS